MPARTSRYLDAAELCRGAHRDDRIAPNVINLPLRPPAALARGVASLDLLSGGRVELGLGAGGFWDAIAAMGGRRLRPAEAVRALEEAIAIIRGIWATGERGMLLMDGEFYQVHGARRGPRPAHDIGIWLGAYRPRMLALTGRVADGWVPSLGYLEPDRLAEANTIIDEAADAAGRRPSDVRRILNLLGPGQLPGSTRDWPDQLAELTLRDGISVFVLGSDDPSAIEQFAGEVVPAVRELVASGRGGPVAPVAATGAVTAPSAPLDVETTPDPGERLSAAQVWDETTRPSRPMPAEGVAYTDHGRAAGQHLIDVHDHLRGELAQLRDVATQVLAGSLAPERARSAINEMTMRQNNWTLGAYCASYCRILTQHHGLEDDAIFPYLRASEKALEPVIDRLVEEHEIIHQVLDDLDRALVAYVDSTHDAGPLQATVDILTDALLSHLAYEERELAEALARYGFYPGQLD